MTNIDKAVIARLKKEGMEFEVLVDCEKALAFRQGKCSLEEALASEHVYKNAKKNERYSSEELESSFGTSDENEIAAIVLVQGEIQLTTEHKNREREEIRKRIISLLHSNAIDSRTGLPHPAERIERAIEQAHVRIEDRPAEQQIHSVAEKINEILPIKFEMRELSVTVKPAYAKKIFGSIKQLSKMIRSEWLQDGSLLAVVEIAAGLQPDFEDRLNALAHGNIEIKLISKK